MRSMKPVTLRWLGVLLFAVASVLPGTAEEPRPLPPGSPNLPVVRVHDFRAAGAADASVTTLFAPASYEVPFHDAFTAMHADARCSRFIPRGIDVNLTWSSGRAGGEAFRVDITPFSDGFEKGTYLTSGERPAFVKELFFAEAQPGIDYYWRLLTKTPAGWVVGGAGRFDAPICPVDEGKEEEE